MSNRYAYLDFFVKDDQLREQYDTRIVNHNLKIINTYPDAGFDIMVPERIVVPAGESVKIPMGVRSSMSYQGAPCSYYIYLRSSMGAKTRLRLANHVGIIDSGYRGELMCVLDNVGKEEEIIEKYTRIAQICGPNLKPIQVRFVEDLELSTFRGTGGFGSTGR